MGNLKETASIVGLSKSQNLTCIQINSIIQIVYIDKM